MKPTASVPSTLSLETPSYTTPIQMLATRKCQVNSEYGSSLVNVIMKNDWIVLQLRRQHEVSGDVQAGVRLQEDEVQLHRCGLAQQRQ